MYREEDVLVLIKKRIFKNQKDMIKKFVVILIVSKTKPSDDNTSALLFLLIIKLVEGRVYPHPRTDMASPCVSVSRLYKAH